MGQIVAQNAKAKRCNIQAIQSGGSMASIVLQNGEYMLVATDNLMDSNGNGLFDSYVVGDGITACSNLTITKIDDIPEITTDATPTSGSTNPVQSGGVYTALSGKQETLVSGTTIKTINNASLLGSGNIDVATDISGKADKATTLAGYGITDSYTKSQVDAIYEGFTQSDIVVVASADWPLSTLEENIIYRVQGTTSYSDYMYDGTNTIKLAEYNNAIDDEPTVGSNNLVKSGGVYNAIAAAASGAGASVSIDKNSDATTSYTLIFLQNVEKYILIITLQDSTQTVFANTDVTINGNEYTTTALGVVSLELFSGSRTLVINVEGCEEKTVLVNMDSNKSITLTLEEYVAPSEIILTNAVNSNIPSKYVNAPLMNLVASALTGVEYSTDPVLLDEDGNPAKYMTKQQAEYYTGDLFFYNKTGSTSVTSLAQLVFFSNASLVYRSFAGMTSVTGDFVFKGYIKSLSSAFYQTQLSKIDLSEAKSYSDPLIIDAGAPAGITTFPTGFVILSTNMNSFGYNSAPVNFNAPKLGIHSTCASMFNFFRAATNTETIKMGDCYLSGITNITNAFYNCSKLRTIEATFHADLDLDISLSACPLTSESVECVLGALKPYTKDSGTHTITFNATAKTNYNAAHQIVDPTYTSALQEAVANLGWTLA